MGNLEKAGVGVVVVLLLVIMVVAFTTDPDPQPMPEADRTEAALSTERHVDSTAQDAVLGNPAVAPMRPVVTRPVPTRPEPTPTRSEPAGEVLEAATRPVTAVTTTAEVVQPTSAPEASPTPSSRPATPSSRPRQVTVNPNDSLWSIAAAHYGNGPALAMSKKIRQLNKLPSDRLAPGQVLKLPDAPVKAAASSGRPGGERVIGGGAEKTEHPASSTRKVGGAGLPWEPGATSYGAGSGRSTKGLYVVKENESLSTIAQRELGSIRFVKQIMELNGIRDPNRIAAGATIKLPSRPKPGGKKK